ncbi:MAG: MDR family MFS transporter [Candidatus Hodarchaeota archaeon]
MFTKIKQTYNQYPKSFKVLTLATFIDQLGTFLLYPFFALYITEKFGVGMTEVGFLFSFFSAGNIIGGVLGGALADKYGRRAIILFGLIVSGIGSIFMGLINDLYIFFIIVVFLGLLGNLGGPARQAMVVDLLPKEKQAQGFGVLRVAYNLSATIGPIFGGFLASQSFMLLFIADAMSSLITGIIVFLVIPETKPQKQDEKQEESVIKTVIGYKDVLKDWVYMLFLSVSSITVLVYVQINSTLSVFLRDVHGFPTQSFGFLFSLNAIMVVLFQLWITRKISKYSPIKMMILGSFFYMIGFGMFGFISASFLFFIAVAIITIGEMIIVPIGQTAAAFFAPEDKRGRYMAFYGFHWAIPNLFAVILAGLVIDHLGPYWVWYLAGILSMISIVGFWVIHSVAKDRFVRKEESSSEEDAKTLKLTITETVQ